MSLFYHLEFGQLVTSIKFCIGVVFSHHLAQCLAHSINAQDEHINYIYQHISYINLELTNISTWENTLLKTFPFLSRFGQPCNLRSGNHQNNFYQQICSMYHAMYIQQWGKKNRCSFCPHKPYT